PPVFLTGSVRLFSGFDLVTSSNVETVMKRRPGDVGLNFLNATWRSPPSSHPSEATGQARHPENARAFCGSYLCPLEDLDRLALADLDDRLLPARLRPAD